MCSGGTVVMCKTYSFEKYVENFNGIRRKKYAKLNGKSFFEIR